MFTSQEQLSEVNSTMIITICDIITLPPTRCQQVMGGEMMMTSILVIILKVSSETCPDIVSIISYDDETSFRTKFVSDDEE